MAWVKTAIGGEVGEQLSKRDSKKEKSYLDSIKSMWDNTKIPTLEEQEIALSQYDPALLEEAFTVDGTAYDEISLDPATRDAQMAALARLQTIGDEGGMDAQARSQIEATLSRTDRQARGAREAVSQNMRARGLGGSGLDMVSQQMANQDAAQIANQEGLNTAAMAQQRALDAIMNSANLGGQIRNQDYGEAAQRAQAMDAIRSFNANQNQGVSTRNTDRQNERSYSNTDLKNQQQMHNKGLYQQQFDNNVARNMGASGALQDLSSYYGNRAQGTKEKYTGLGRAMDQDDQDKEDKAYEGGMQAAKSGGSAMMGGSDERLKENISDVSVRDIREFLGAIRPKNYTYKDPEKAGCSEGEKIGFMLQDVEHTVLGKKLIQRNEEGMMMYDLQNLQGIILSALAYHAKGAL